MTITCPNGHTQHIVNEEDLREEVRCPECGATFSTLDTATND